MATCFSWSPSTLTVTKGITKKCKIEGCGNTDICWEGQFAGEICKTCDTIFKRVGYSPESLLDVHESNLIGLNDLLDIEPGHTVHLPDCSNLLTYLTRKMGKTVKMHKFATLEEFWQHLGRVFGQPVQTKKCKVIPFPERP